MPAHEALHGLQFQYDTLDTGASKPMHRVRAFAGPTYQNVGTMIWSNDHVRNIQVDPQHHRRGVGTSLWNEGHRIASEERSVPAPKHSPDRTDAGDAWARKVGGSVPRRLERKRG